MTPDEIAVRNVLDVFEVEITAAYEAADPERPGLLTVMADPFKKHTVAALTRYRADGTYFKRSGGGVPPHRTNQVTFIDQNTAEAFQCLVDDRLQYKRGNDQPVDTEVSRLGIKATVIRGPDLAWRISDEEGQTPQTTAARCQGI